MLMSGSLEIIPSFELVRSSALPPPSQAEIAILDQFSGPKELASYIQHLMSHPYEYAKYFEWKKQPLRDSFIQVRPPFNHPCGTSQAPRLAPT